MEREDLAMLSGGRWFACVPPALRERLLSRGQVVSARTGTVFYAVDDAPDGLRAILEGEVRLISYPAVGTEAVVSILGRGAWFGELSTLDELPRPHNAVAAEPTKVLHISAAAFDAAAREEPQFYRALGLLVCTRQRASLTFMSQAIAQPLSVRVARTIAVATHGDGPLKIRQEDLAAMLGVSRQSVNKELKVLEAAGVVALSYQQIAVLDLPRLKKLGKPAE